MNNKILDRTRAPQRYRIKSIPRLSYPAKLCAGSLPTYSVEGGTEEIVKIDVVFKAGTRYEDKPLVASLCSAMLKEGTANYSGNEIAEKIDFYGAHIVSNISKDRTEITLLCLKKHLESLIDIFTDIILMPVFPETDFEALKKRQRSRLSVNLDKVSFKARLLFSELLFEDFPYRDCFALTDYDEVTRADIVSYFKENYTFSSAYAVISGKDTDDVFAIFEKALEQKKEAINTLKHPDEKIEWNYSGAKEKKIKKEGAVQTAIRLGGPAPRRNDVGYASFYIANVILGGYFGSRLMQNIREEKGYTYGIGSHITIMEEAAYFSIGTQVGAGFTQATCDEIHKEIRKISNEPVPAEELELVQHYIAGNLLKRFDGPFATADRLKILINSGLEPDTFSTFSAAVFGVTGNAVLEASHTYFDPDRLCTALAGEW